MLSLSLSAAHATPITWTLQDVTFDDGGTALGSFVYDADSGIHGTYSSISVVTTPGTSFAGTIYADTTGIGSSTLFQAVDGPVDGDFSGDNALTFWHSAALTNAGGTVPID
jgi:hypothetical protein